MRKKKKLEHINKFVKLRALALGVPNAKFLAFGTTNTKKPSTLDVLNAKKFGFHEQYNSKFGTVWMEIVKKKIGYFILLLSLSLSLRSDFLSAFLAL